MCIFIYLHPLYHVIQPPILIYFARPILMGQNWGFEALDFEVVPIFRETKLDVIKENHPISLLNRPRCTGELAIWPSPKRWWGAGAGADIGMRDVRCYKVGKPWMIVYYFSLLPRMYIYIYNIYIQIYRSMYIFLARYLLWDSARLYISGTADLHGTVEIKTMVPWWVLKYLLV